MSDGVQRTLTPALATALGRFLLRLLISGALACSGEKEVECGPQVVYGSLVCGDACEEYIVDIYPEDRTEWSGTLVASDGTYQFDSVSPGDHDLQVSPPWDCAMDMGMTDNTAEFTVCTDPVEIDELEPWCH